GGGTALPRRGTIVLTLRAPWSARALRRAAIILGAVLSHAVFGLKLAVGALVVAVAVLAIMNYREPEPAVTGFEPDSNETVVYRRAGPPPARSGGGGAGGQAPDQKDGAGPPKTRAVQNRPVGKPPPPPSTTPPAR